MVRLGRTYAGLMVGVAPRNEKLRERARRNRHARQRRRRGRRRRGARSRRRRRARRARRAARRRRPRRPRARGSTGPAARCALALGRHGVRLGVEAALVGGELVLGRRRGRRRARRRRRPRRRRARTHRGPRLRRPPGERLRRRRLPRRLERGLRARRRGAAAHGRDLVPADVHHGGGEHAARGAARACRRTAAGRASSARTSRARSCPPERLGHAPARASPRPRPGAARPAARHGPRDGVSPSRPSCPARAPLIRRLLERGIVVSAGHTNATAEEAHEAFDLGVSTVDAPLQRDAAVPLARSRRSSASRSRAATCSSS